MLKIMNVKMVVDEEENEVRAYFLLHILSLINKGADVFKFYNKNADFFNMLVNCGAIRVMKIDSDDYSSVKGERFAEVYAWLKEMLEEGAEDEENFDK